MSLRSRLAVIGVATVAASIAIMAALTYGTIRVQARSAVDDTLQREADQLAVALPEALAAAAGPDGALDDQEVATVLQRVLALNPGSDQHLAAVTAAGATFTTDAAPDVLDDLRDDGALPLGEPGRLTTVETDEGPVRVLALPLRTEDGEVGRLSVLGPLAEARADARDALVVVLAAGLIALVVGGATIVLATRRALRPLHDLADAAQGVDADLASRLPAAPRADEVGTLTVELNRMLDRLALDGERRRAVLAAVSHELRTPLAVARGHVEVFRTLDAEPGSPADRTAATIDDELTRMSRLVDDLTAVARGTLAQEVELGPVFLPDVVEDLRQRVQALGLTDVTVPDAPPLVIEVDAGRLAQSLLNLVLNATTHTPDGTPVRVEAEAAGDEVILRVVDRGPGIDPAVADDVFEPFVTTRPTGPQRARGLGLPVVRALTEAQGGRVELTTGPGGTTVSLRFPRSA